MLLAKRGFHFQQQQQQSCQHGNHHLFRSYLRAASGINPQIHRMEIGFRLQRTSVFIPSRKQRGKESQQHVEEHHFQMLRWSKKTGQQWMSVLKYTCLLSQPKNNPYLKGLKFVHSFSYLLSVNWLKYT